MKDSPKVRITMEGVEDYVEVTRAVMDALIFTTTDHLEYAVDNYTEGSQECKEGLEGDMHAIMEYMWPNGKEF